MRLISYPHFRHTWRNCNNYFNYFENLFRSQNSLIDYSQRGLPLARPYISPVHNRLAAAFTRIQPIPPIDRVLRSPLTEAARPLKSKVPDLIGLA